jgi:flagellar motor protein MotB
MASNDDAEGRAKNRRVEMAPTPRRAGATAKPHE